MRNLLTQLRKMESVIKRYSMCIWLPIINSQLCGIVLKILTLLYVSIFHISEPSSGLD
jgi:hypothetical protein